METPCENHHDVGEGSGSSAIDFRGSTSRPGPQPTAYIHTSLGILCMFTRFLDKMQS